MARRIQPIFDRILADDRIQGRERTFVESLQESYKRRKSLTPGRRRCLVEIEQRLDAPPVDVDPGLTSSLETLVSRATAANDAWAADFAKSLLAQAQTGKKLSVRQVETLAKLQDRHSDAAVESRQNWASNFTPEMREKMELVARYYRSTSMVYHDLVDKVLTNSDFVPSKRQWEKLVENKYAKKVLVSTFSEPKFHVGQFVTFRAAARVVDTRGRFATGNQFVPRRIGRFAKGFVVAVGAQPVISAARGTKVYTILFIGQASPTLVEERYLKKAKK